MRRAPVFAETREAYLAEIRSLDYLARAGPLGLESDGDGLLIPLYDRLYRLSGSNITDARGEHAPPGVGVILCKYVLMCPDPVPTAPGHLMSYREFPDAAPLISYFTTNTNKTIEAEFSGKLGLLAERGAGLGGRSQMSESFDLCLEFSALPRIPVTLNFNDRDELFPAACSVLYRSTAARFLDMECLAMTGTLLAGRLVAP